MCATMEIYWASLLPHMMMFLILWFAFTSRVWSPCLTTHCEIVIQQGQKLCIALRTRRLLLVLKSINGWSSLPLPHPPPGVDWSWAWWTKLLCQKTQKLVQFLFQILILTFRKIWNFHGVLVKPLRAPSAFQNSPPYFHTPPICYPFLMYPPFFWLWCSCSARWQVVKLIVRDVTQIGSLLINWRNELKEIEQERGSARDLHLRIRGSFP